MASARALNRLQQLTWVLIYGGLFALVLGLSLKRSDEATAWAMMLAGVAATLVGVVLIYLRSRLKETP